MNCSQARDILFPTPEKALVTIETPRAMDHLRVCKACQAFFEQQEEFSNNLRAKAATEPAPDALRERVAQFIEEHRSPAPSLSRRFLPAAGAVVLLLGLGAIWFATRMPTQELFREMCLDHAKYLDAQSQLPSSDPAAIEAWFRDKAEFRVN